MSSAHELTATADEGCLERIHDLLAAVWAAEPSITLRDRMRLEGAVVEVANNIVQHSPAGTAGPTVRLCVERVPGGLRAVLHDDAPAVAPDLRVAMPGWDAEHGRGIPLALALTDELRHERLPAGNRWELVCLESG